MPNHLLGNRIEAAGMRGIICYYSGSGNTKLACRYIAKKVESIEIDLFNIVKEGTPNFDGYDIVGFATFTNFLAPSKLVQTFLEHLPSQKDKLAFVFNTYGFRSGRTLSILGEWVTAKGFSVMAGHSLHTPESYPPMIARGMGNEQAPDEKEMANFERFISKLRQLVCLPKSLREIERKNVRVGMLDRLLPSYPLTKAKKDMGEKLFDPSLCTKCGVCEKLCPCGAIRLDEYPVFSEEKCYGCWACYNHCPKKAIHTRKYRGIGQYPNPHIQLREKLKV